MYALVATGGTTTQMPLQQLHNLVHAGGGGASTAASATAAKANALAQQQQTLLQGLYSDVLAAMDHGVGAAAAGQQQQPDFRALTPAMPPHAGPPHEHHHQGLAQPVSPLPSAQLPPGAALQQGSASPDARCTAHAPADSPPAAAQQQQEEGGDLVLAPPSHAATPDPAEGPEVAAEYEQYLQRWAAGDTLAQRWHRLAERGVLAGLRDEWEEWQSDLKLAELQAQIQAATKHARKKRAASEVAVDLDAPRQARTRRVPTSLQDYQVEAVSGGDFTPPPPSLAAAAGRAAPAAAAAAAPLAYAHRDTTPEDGEAGGYGSKRSRLAGKQQQPAGRAQAMQHQARTRGGGALVHHTQQQQQQRQHANNGYVGVPAGIAAQTAAAAAQKKAAGSYMQQPRQHHNQQQQQAQAQEQPAWGYPAAWEGGGMPSQHQRQQQQQPLYHHGSEAMLAPPGTASHHPAVPPELLAQMYRMGTAIGNSAAATAIGSSAPPAAMAAAAAGLPPLPASMSAAAAFEAFSRMLGQVQDPVKFTADIMAHAHQHC